MVVLDASVLVELVVRGRHRAGADRILDAYRAPPGLVMVSAAHALVEATDALRRLVRQGRLEANQGERATLWLASLGMTLDASAPRLARVWELRDRMSAYDAAYAAAAEALGVPLVSVDRRLIGACRSAGIEVVELDQWPGPLKPPESVGLPVR